MSTRLGALRASAACNLGRLKDVIHEQTLAAALSGNDSVFASAVGDLGRLPESDRDRRRLESLHNLFSGRVAEAVEDLEAMAAADGSDVATWAILEVAYDDFSLDLDGESRSTGRLKHLESRTELEKLMAGFAIPEEDIQPLRDLSRANPGWSIARAMLARGLCRIAYFDHDESALLDARSEIDAAIALRPSNPFVTSIALEVATTEYVFSGRNSEQAEVAQAAKQECQRLVGVLDGRFPDYQFGLRRIAEFYSASEQYQAALLSWKRLITEFSSSAALFYYLPIALFERQALEIEEDLVFPHYYLYVDDPANALKSCGTTKWKSSTLARTWKPHLLYLCGLDAEAEAAVRDAMPLTETHAAWVSNVIRLYAGQIGEAEMLQEIKDDCSLKTHHLLTLAFHSLTQPSGRQAAIDYTNRALANDHRVNDTYYWGKALKQRLISDPAWPESLKSRLESSQQ